MSIRLSLLRVIAAFSAVLVGFVAIAVPVASLASATVLPSKYSSMDEYLSQTVKWNSCGTDLYCGVVSVR